MKFEIQVFILLIIIGLVVKKIDWRGQFFLCLFIGAWIFYNWKRG
jgi:hypothetical protein